MGNSALVLRKHPIILNRDLSFRTSHTSSHDLIKEPRAQRLTQNVIKEILDQDIREFYDIDKQPVLGSGVSGQVKICVHKATKMQFALKTLTKSDLTPAKLLRLRNEVGCMALLDHPNILRVHEVFETDSCTHLVMELCKGGDLMDRLSAQQNRQYREVIACKYIYSILNAVAYCHANNVVHRDLKLENVLFETEGQESELKIIDFGLGHHWQPHDRMHNCVGTSYYVAPEVLDGNYDAKCDVWSIGVIAYMLLSGTPPFTGSDDGEIVTSIIKGVWQFDQNLFAAVSPDAKDFISKCLTRKAFWRPSAAAALKHKWFCSLKTQREPLPSVNVIRRFSSFMIRSTLAKIFMDVVAHTLLPEQVADLRDQFNKFDVSHTGSISVHDLRAIMRQFTGFREEYLGVMVASLDLDQKGRIGYHEFLAATIRRVNVAEENLQIAFEVISNHGEFITAGDVAALLGGSSYKLDALMGEVGLDLDSKISYAEFKSILDGNEDGHSYLDAYDGID